MNQTTSTTQLAKRPIEMSKGGLVLKSIDDLWRIADAAHQSGLAPRTLNTPQKVFIAMEYGAEYGIPPMKSLQCIAVINNRPAFWGDVVKGMVLDSGRAEYIRETFEGEPYEDTFCAVCESKRKDSGEVVRTTFSVADAKTAKLWMKKGKYGDSTWVTHPKRMLTYRARGFNLRDNFADVTQGLHLAEELQGIPPEHPPMSEQAADVPSRDEHVGEVVDVKSEAKPAPFERIAVEVRERLANVLPPGTQVNNELVAHVLPLLAGQANNKHASVFRETDAWTDEVAGKCIDYLNERGILDEWLPGDTNGSSPSPTTTAEAS